MSTLLPLTDPQVVALACDLYKSFWGHSIPSTEDVRWLGVAQRALELGARLPSNRETAAKYNAQRLGWCSCPEPTRLEPRSTICSTCDKVISSTIIGSPSR